MVKTKRKSKEQTMDQRRSNSGGLDRKRLGAVFRSSEKRLDRRRMRGCALGVFDLDTSSFDLGTLDLDRSGAPSKLWTRF